MEQQLLLCCQLGQTVRPLSRREYLPLAETLRLYPDIGLNWDTLAALGYDRSFCIRVMELLNRQEVLMDYLGREPMLQLTWPGHVDYPLRLERLGDMQPLVLFCKGDISILRKQSVSLVGSREIAAKNAEFARRIGRMAAEEGLCLVSGHARGADLLAQEACLEAGGRVIAFVPDRLTDYMERENILYVSEDGYDQFFTAQRALRRNTLIHALGDACFVAQCAETAGGTWSGTSENLRRGYSRVYAWDDGSRGVKALQELGAKLLREPPTGLREFLRD